MTQTGFVPRTVTIIWHRGHHTRGKLGDAMHILRCLFVAVLVMAVSGTATRAGQRVALVIGNGAYKNAGTLANPKNDATDMQAALKAYGFKVILGIDLDKRGLDGKVREFTRLLANADDAVFFYAGHGLQVSGQNYLVPVDAKLEGERDLEFEAMRFDFVLRQMELNRETKTNIVFLDACRNNPLTRNLARSMGTRSASIGQGLAQVDAGVGTFVSFSTQPGNVALDGTGRNSPFAGALTKRIMEPGRNLNAVMIEVRKDVLAATSGKQVPWDHSALTGDFYFDPSAAKPPVNANQSPVPEGETKALNERILKLEDELKLKADSEQSSELERLKDQAKQIQAQNREDWERIFELRRNAQQASPSDRAREMESEAMRMQMKIARRGAESKRITDQISAMEAKAAEKK